MDQVHSVVVQPSLDLVQDRRVQPSLDLVQGRRHLAAWPAWLRFAAIAERFVIEHVFAAARERVFEAWVSPEVLRRWWGAGPDWTAPSVEIDLRPGGRYRLSMQDPSGTVRTVGGRYVEVDPPRRLVYTWAWEPPHGDDGDDETLVTVDFHEPAAGETRVVLTHSGFADAVLRDDHREGWELCIANLRSRVLDAG